MTDVRASVQASGGDDSPLAPAGPELAGAVVIPGYRRILTGLLVPVIAIAGVALLSGSGDRVDDPARAALCFRHGCLPLSQRWLSARPCQA